MKICIVGAGAIGGMLAVRFASLGHEVTVIVRGRTLEAVRAKGMKLITDGGETTARVRATDRLAEAGRQDVVMLTMKAHQLPAVAPELPGLFDDGTVVVSAQNGVPWWYFSQHGGPYEGRQLESVDPGGIIAANIPVERVVGAIVYVAAEIVEPGVIRHVEQNRFTLGEPDGSESDRIRSLAELFRAAGFRAPIAKRIRDEIWVKLWGNCTFNPISALTHATLVDICRFPATRTLAASMMAEAQRVGEALGVEFKISIDKRIAGAEAVGAHKTSMLQDVEAGKPIELEALLGAVLELARTASVDTPVLTTVYALTRLLAQTLAESRGRLRIEPA